MRRTATDNHQKSGPRRPHGAVRATAAALAIFFATAQAAASAPAPEGPAPAPAAAPESAPAPAPAPEGAATPAPDSAAPTAAEPAPVAEPAQAPEAAPAPEDAPPEAAPAPEGPELEEGPPPPISPKERAKANKLRKAGGVMMGTGGVLGAVGLVLTIGYTVRGTGYENELIAAQERYTDEECSRVNKERCPLLAANVSGIEGKIESADQATRIGGLVFLGGVAVTAVGGVLYRLGTKRLKHSEFVLAPTVGGAVISGRF